MKSGRILQEMDFWKAPRPLAWFILACQLLDFHNSNLKAANMIQDAAKTGRIPKERGEMAAAALAHTRKLLRFSMKKAERNGFDPNHWPRGNGATQYYTDVLENRVKLCFPKEAE